MFEKKKKGLQRDTDFFKQYRITSKKKQNKKGRIYSAKLTERTNPLIIPFTRKIQYTVVKNLILLQAVGSALL